MFAQMAFVMGSAYTIILMFLGVLSLVYSTWLYLLCGLIAGGLTLVIAGGTIGLCALAEKLFP